eukprot:TRINITY_DN3681_c0_g1_i3.p1 TRINITY_DN3681_c0_g1~~TRINITY_DN3681_c0_g1_i3.p1  ORF type:complete len:1149 (+),score=205.66 TRINITY_DN3681_c0_g1_i3:190-3636(+)
MSDVPANVDEQVAGAQVDSKASSDAFVGSARAPVAQGGIETLLSHYDAVVQNQRTDPFRGGPIDRPPMMISAAGGSDRSPEQARPMSASPAPQGPGGADSSMYNAPRQISNVFGTREDPFASVWVAPQTSDDAAVEATQQPAAQQPQAQQPPQPAPQALQQHQPPQPQQPSYQPPSARSVLNHPRAQSFHVGAEGPSPRHWTIDQARSQSFIDMHPSSLALQHAQQHHHQQQQQHLAQAEMLQSSPSSAPQGQLASQHQHYSQGGVPPRPSASDDDGYRLSDMVDPGDYSSSGSHPSPIPEFGMLNMNDPYQSSLYDAPEPIQAPNLFGEHPHGEHPSRTLFVRNINSNVEDEELLILFEQYGPIRSMYTQCKHRGFVMISYFDIRHAKNAMRNLQGKVLRRRKLDIHYSIPKDNPSEKDQNQAQGTLVVFNLDPTTTNDELRSIFGAFGEIKEIRETPNKRHHKFIEFYDVRDAEKAMKFLNKTEIRGKKIKIEPSRPGGAQRRPMLSPSSSGRASYDEASDPLGPQDDFAPPPQSYGSSQYSPNYNAPHQFKPRYAHDSYGQQQHRQPANSYAPPQRSASYGSSGHFQSAQQFAPGSRGTPPPPPQYAAAPGGYAPPPHHQPTYSAPPPTSYGGPSSYDPRGVAQPPPPPVYSQQPVSQSVYGTPGQAQLYQQPAAPINSPPMTQHAVSQPAYQNAAPQYGQPLTRVGSGGHSSQLPSYQPGPPPQPPTPQYTQFGPTQASTTYAYEPHSGEYRPILQQQQQPAPGPVQQAPPSNEYYHHVVSAPQMPIMNSGGEYRTVMQPVVIGSPQPSVIMHSSGEYVFNVHSSGEYRVLGGSQPSSSGEYHSGEYAPIMINSGSSGEYRPGNHSNHSSSGEYPPPSSWGERRLSEDTDSPARTKHQQRKGSDSMFGTPGSGDSDNQGKFALDINKVASGEDIRSTIMIRNIPNKYSQKMLLSAVDENFKGCYDFFYLPIDFKNKCNVGYAFINITSPDAIIRFYSEFNNKKWERFNSEKVCEIAYARIQGKNSLISHFQNSSLMSEDKKCRPIIFNAQGVEEAFPLNPGHVALNKRRSSLVAAQSLSPSSSEEKESPAIVQPAPAASTVAADEAQPHADAVDGAAVASAAMQTPTPAADTGGQNPVDNTTGI